MRSFHATEEDGAESICDSLGLTQKEVDVCVCYPIYMPIVLIFPPYFLVLSIIMQRIVCLVQNLAGDPELLLQKL